MKKIFLTFFIIVSLFSFAQETVTQETNTIPPGYYATATGTGYVLKTQLYNIIKNHNDQGYGGLYTTYLTSDIDNVFENDGTILDMYSENPTGTDPYNFTTGTAQRCGNYNSEGDCYNREHIIPQSIFNSNSPMVSDAHFVTPSDGKVNGQRGNMAHGQVGNANIITLNGSKIGPASNTGYAAGFTGTVFEPIDEFKGDIARMYFYFATRYENGVSGYPYVAFNGTSNQVFTDAYKNILLTWNQLDPVSPREINRNNAIYARQNNRNPYIDNNAFVTAIWGEPLETKGFDAFRTISVFPNPTNNHKVNIQTTAIIDDIQLINSNGQLVLQVKNPVAINSLYSLENLPQGFYFLKLTSNNQTVTKKMIVN